MARDEPPTTGNGPGDGPDTGPETGPETGIAGTVLPFPRTGGLRPPIVPDAPATVLEVPGRTDVDDELPAFPELADDDFGPPLHLLFADAVPAPVDADEDDGQAAVHGAEFNRHTAPLYWAAGAAAGLRIAYNAADWMRARAEHHREEAKNAKEKADKDGDGKKVKDGAARRAARAALQHVRSARAANTGAARPPRGGSSGGLGGGRGAASGGGRSAGGASGAGRRTAASPSSGGPRKTSGLSGSSGASGSASGRTGRGGSTSGRGTGSTGKGGGASSGLAGNAARWLGTNAAQKRAEAKNAKSAGASSKNGPKSADTSGGGSGSKGGSKAAPKTGGGKNSGGTGTKGASGAGRAAGTKSAAAKRAGSAGGTGDGSKPGGKSGSKSGSKSGGKSGGGSGAGSGGKGTSGGTGTSGAKTTKKAARKKAARAEAKKTAKKAAKARAADEAAKTAKSAEDEASGSEAPDRATRRAARSARRSARSARRWARSARRLVRAARSKARRERLPRHRAERRWYPKGSPKDTGKHTGKAAGKNAPKGSSSGSGPAADSETRKPPGLAGTGGGRHRRPSRGGFRSWIARGPFAGARVDRGAPKPLTATDGADAGRSSEPGSGTRAPWTGPVFEDEAMTPPPGMRPKTWTAEQVDTPTPLSAAAASAATASTAASSTPPRGGVSAYPEGPNDVPARTASPAVPGSAATGTGSDLTIEELIGADGDAQGEITGRAEGARIAASMAEDLVTSLEGLQARVAELQVPGSLAGSIATLIDACQTVRGHADDLIASLPRAAEAIGSAGTNASDRHQPFARAVADAGHTAPAEAAYHQE
ncbi:hypothetical protein [Streptodolium elevatio]